MPLGCASDCNTRGEKGEKERDSLDVLKGEKAVRLQRKILKGRR